MIKDKIAVIMPCTLQDYHGAASNRPLKLNRAIQSFLNQDYPLKELIIVADGCHQTVDFIRDNYPDEQSIKCYFIEKQPLFSGAVRHVGISAADAQYIAYLDSDDFFKDAQHLSVIVRGFHMHPHCGFVFFDDFLKFFVLDHLLPERRIAVLDRGTIGTSNIAHWNTTQVSWNGKNGYGHDFYFIQELMASFQSVKIEGGSYVVCHIPNSCDS